LLAQIDRQDRASIKRVHPPHEIRNLDIRVTIVLVTELRPVA